MTNPEFDFSNTPDACGQQPGKTPPPTGVSIDGNVAVNTGGAVVRAAVYATNIPNSRIYVGSEYKDAEKTDGFLSFKPDTTTYYPHPFQEKTIAYRLGTLVITDKDLICHLDNLIAEGQAPFYRAKDFSFDYGAPALVG